MPWKRCVSPENQKRLKNVLKKLQNIASLEKNLENGVALRFAYIFLYHESGMELVETYSWMGVKHNSVSTIRQRHTARLHHWKRSRRKFSPHSQTAKGFDMESGRRNSDRTGGQKKLRVMETYKKQKIVTNYACLFSVTMFDPRNTKKKL